MKGRVALYLISLGFPHPLPHPLIYNFPMPLSRSVECD